MDVQFDRIARLQENMRRQGLVAIVVLNHDDFRYLFGEDRAQPRAIVPFEGSPEIIVFTGEEPDVLASLGAAGSDGRVRVFRSVGGQINDVVGRIRELAEAGGRAGLPPGQSGRPKVGLQMWFGTPAFMVDLFRQVNPEVEVVPSDPALDPLRAVKDGAELERMAQAQRIAGVGMDRARELLRPGVTGREIATETLYAMMRAGAEGTSTPIHVNLGPDTCMLHGRLSTRPLESGQMAIVDLTPQVDGYCANLARTFVVGPPGERESALIETYRQIVEAVRPAMVPGATVGALDAVAKTICERRGLADLQVYGIGHGIGLRFEERPAPTIIPPHKSVPLEEGMTVTIGHTVLAIPGLGGARFEDVYRVTPRGASPLAEYPIDPFIAA
jgi:Xaa-Pro dipeptidase